MFNAQEKSQLQHIDTRYTGEFKYPRADEFRIARSMKMIGTGKRVLDVGAFNGQISAEFQRAGNEVTAMDASRQALEVAAARGIATIEADIAKPWPTDLCAGSFDAVFAGEVLEHVIDTDFFLSQCYSVLKPGGTLVLTTPNLASLGRRLLLLLGRNPLIDIGLRPDQPGHVRYFVAGSLRELLIDNGFKVHEMSGDYLQLSMKDFGSAWGATVFPSLARCLIVKATRGDS